MHSELPAALRVDLQRPDGEWVSVGILQRVHETTTFSSFSAYWELPRRPVLGQIFEERGPDWKPAASTALPTWFSNLLPEGRLRQAIARDTGVNEQREFFLLARIGGDDLPGALRVVPVDPNEPPAEADVEDLDDFDAEEAHPLKFSLDGVQLKFSAGETERGLTVPATGDSSRWIAKLPDSRPEFRGVPEAEFAALELARAVGIEVPRARLVDVNSIEGLPDWATAGGGNALVVERFDRRAGGRVHAEELAQILNLRPRRKYGKANFETVARFTAALTGAESVGLVIDRLVLNALIGNGDAHIKNWGFVYEDGISPTLAPAYDILPTVLYMPNDNFGLNLNGSRSFDDINLAAFERLAEKAGWDGALGRERARDAVSRVLAAWPVLEGLLTQAQLIQLTRRRDGLKNLMP
jgi:serine/threonine-protein kinase HipA